MRYLQLIIKACVLLYLLTGFTGCFKDLTHITVVYHNDFENADTSQTLKINGFNSNGGYATFDIRTRYFNGSKVLGKFNSNAVTVALANLPSHDIIRTEYDLYIHDKWKNDLWKMTVDNSDQLLTGFSNDSSVQQSYPNWLGNGSPTGPAGRNAVSTHLAGTCGLQGSAQGSSQYHIIQTISHTQPNFTLILSDAGAFFNDTCQRSWSVDNLNISLIRNR